MKSLAVLWCALLFPCLAWSQDADIEHRPFAIGEINYFGYGDLPLPKIRAAVPWHVGDTLTFATFSKKPVEDAVSSVIGKTPTDVNIVCCDTAQHLEVFIGLPGSTYRPVPARPEPSGNAHLDPEGMRLYQQDMSRLAQAVEHGNAGEDDSLGYMVSHDPELKAINLATRAYALHREPELTAVLQSASDPEDRRAAAELLGYVQASTTQAEALARATTDPDNEVRNNAVRALAVLTAASSIEHPHINIQPLVDLLYSGTWTDRNKASLLLFRMTDTRNPDILRTLKREALPALIEGASWTDVPGHSTPFLVILGRIGGIPDPTLDAEMKSGNSTAIIAAAKASKL